MNFESFKQGLKRWLPPAVVDAQRSIRKSLNPSATAHEQVIEKLRSEHELRQTGKHLTDYVLRDGIEFRVSPLARPGFDHFCFVDPEMVYEMDLFLNLARNSRRFLDVGALHGVFSLAFASLSSEHTALAFEPSPMAYPFLLYHRAVNPGLGIATMQKALSDSAMTLVMDYHWQHMRALGQGEAVSPETISFETMAGDAACASNQFTPDLIKIDVEGAELMVIRGLLDTLQRHRPILMVEVHPELLPRHQASTSDVLLLLARTGYKLETLSGKKIDPNTFTPALPADRVLATPT